MCDASMPPAPSYAELEEQLATAVAAREEAEADVARLERLHAACDATIRELTSKALAAVREQEAAEARAERLKFQIEREIVFLEDEAATGVSFYEATFTQRAEALRAALAEEVRR